MHLRREVGVLLVPRVRAGNVLVGRGRVDAAQHRGTHQPDGGSGQGAGGLALRQPSAGGGCIGVHILSVMLCRPQVAPIKQVFDSRSWIVLLGRERQPFPIRRGQVRLGTHGFTRSTKKYLSRFMCLFFVQRCCIFAMICFLPHWAARCRGTPSICTRGVETH